MNIISGIFGVFVAGYGVFEIFKGDGTKGLLLMILGNQYMSAK